MASRRVEFTTVELRAGAFVLVSALIMTVFVGAVMKYRPRGNMNTFYVVASETGGLGKAADVRFGGMIVGRVSKMSPNADDQSLVRIAIEVEPTTPVNADSVAFVSQTTLTSEKHLEIGTGTKDASLLEPGSEIPSTVGGLFGDLTGLTSSLEQLLRDVTVLLGITDGEGESAFDITEGKSIAELFVTVEGMLADLRFMLGVVDENGNPKEIENRKTVSELMVNLDVALVEGTGLLEEVRGVLDENRESLTDLLATVGEAGDSAKELVDNLNALLTDNREDIDGVIGSARVALDELNVLLEEFETLTVSIEGVIEENGPTLEDTLRDLSDTMRNMEELTRTLSEQPQSIIRGKQPVGRQ